MIVGLAITRSELVASIVYAPGTLLYIWARREQGMRVFQPAEAVTCGALSLLPLLESS